MYKRMVKKHRAMIGIGILISLISSLLYVGAGYSLSMLFLLLIICKRALKKD